MRSLPFLLAITVLMVGKPTLAMTLSEAFDQATRHDPAIPQSIAIYEAEKAATALVSGERRPRLNAFGHAYSGKSEYDSQLFGSGESSGNQYTYGVELRQPLFRRDWNALGRQARALDQQAEIGREDRIQRMVLRLADRYFGVLLELEAMELARSERESLDKALEDTRNRHEAGVAAQTDLREAQARADLARAGQMRAEVALASARAALHELTNNGQAALPRLRTDVVLPALSPVSEDEWVALARERSLVLLRAREAVTVSRSTVSSARSGYSPTLDAVARYRTDDTTDFPDGQDRTDMLVGVELNVPLYNGGMARARSREASYYHEAARAELARLDLETERRIRQLYREVEADRLQAGALGVAVESAQLARDATRNGYEAGTRTILDVLDAESRVADARRNYASARYGFLVNLLNLRYEAGTLSPDDLGALDPLLTR
ncbi:MAG: TolC family outer membrane protein [Alcanivoracaceae bacterium]